MGILDAPSSPLQIASAEVTAGNTTATTNVVVPINSLSTAFGVAKRTVTVTAGRPIEIRWGGFFYHSTTGSIVYLELYEDGVLVGRTGGPTVLGAAAQGWNATRVRRPSAGVHTYEVKLNNPANSSTATVLPNAAFPVYIHVLGAQPTFSVNYGQSNVTSGEFDWLSRPAGFKADGTVRGVVFCHSRGTRSAGVVDTANAANQAAKIAAIAQLYPVLSTDMGGTTSWGNTAAQTALGQCVTYMTGTVGAKSDKVILVCQSMGAVAALDYAAANPTKVAAVIGFIPVSNLTYMYQNNIGSWQSEMATSWGVTAPAALPAGADPMGKATLTGVTLPVKLWYSSTDVNVRAADVVALAAQIGVNASAVDVGTNGHTDTTIADIPTADVLAFIAANA